MKTLSALLLVLSLSSGFTELPGGWAPCFSDSMRKTREMCFDVDVFGSIYLYFLKLNPTTPVVTLHKCLDIRRVGIFFIANMNNMWISSFYSIFHFTIRTVKQGMYGFKKQIGTTTDEVKKVSKPHIS